MVAALVLAAATAGTDVAAGSIDDGSHTPVTVRDFRQDVCGDGAVPDRITPGMTPAEKRAVRLRHVFNCTAAAAAPHGPGMSPLPPQLV